jgi:CheY-like chemotaxis protein
LGLGLAISRGLIELHGGRLTASSAGPGKGARFVVELPLLRAKVGPRAKGHSAARILIVEDNPETAEALKLALGTNGYVVHHASSSSAALEADLASVDLVVSDLRLPDGDGHSLLRQLLARGPVTAIALSGDGADAVRLATRESGFFAHLTKPVELEVLTDTIERALAVKRQT